MLYIMQYICVSTVCIQVVDATTAMLQIANYDPTFIKKINFAIRNLQFLT